MIFTTLHVHVSEKSCKKHVNISGETCKLLKISCKFLKAGIYDHVTPIWEPGNTIPADTITN